MTARTGLDDLVNGRKEGRESEKALHPLAGVFFEDEEGNRESFSYGDMRSFPVFRVSPLVVMMQFEADRWVSDGGKLVCKRGIWRVTIWHTDRPELESVHQSLVQTKHARIRRGDGFRFEITAGQVEA